MRTTSFNSSQCSYSQIILLIYLIPPELAWGGAVVGLTAAADADEAAFADEAAEEVADAMRG